MGFLIWGMDVKKRVSERGSAMQPLEEAAREEKLAEQNIIRQSLEEKDRKIWELQKKVELLEGMLSRSAAAAAGLPQPQPLPAIRVVPRRWTVR